MALPALGFEIVGVDMIALAMGATTLPMSSPYLMTVSPMARSCRAILCPIGTS